MLHFHHQVSRASRTAFNLPSSTQRTPLIKSRSLALGISPGNSHRIHSRVSVTSNLRQSPRRVPLPGSSPSADRRGSASHVIQPTTRGTEPVVHHEFEPKTGTWQYIVADPSSSRAAIIDPVLDYDPATQLITTTAADSLLSLVGSKGLTIDWILETHAHADHLTAASYLQAQLAQAQGCHKPPVGIGKRIDQVQGLFGERYGIAADEYTDVFDKLFDDDETFSIGGLEASIIHLPGHTPDHLGYKIGDNVFCGDSIFHADIGTARCDFPGGSAKDLWSSTRKLLGLPGHIKIWTGHDYPPSGRGDPVPYMTVKQHRAENRHVRDSITETKFVALRKERDGQLGAPRLLHPSLQMNIRAGRLPRPTNAGQRLLHLPLRLGVPDW